MVKPTTPASAVTPQPRLYEALRALRALHAALDSSDRMLRHSHVLIRQYVVVADELPRPGRRPPTGPRGHTFYSSRP